MLIALLLVVSVEALLTTSRAEIEQPTDRLAYSSGELIVTRPISVCGIFLISL